MQTYPNVGSFEAGRALLPAPERPAVDVERVITVDGTGRTSLQVFRQLAQELATQDAEILGLMVYGGLAVARAVEDAMYSELGETRWPVTWVECAACDAAPLAGVQAFVITGRPVKRVRVGRRIVGSVYEDGEARHCLLGGLTPTAIAGMTRGAQVQQMFGNLEWALEAAGFVLGDVVRTWFYNDDILAWYGDFNRARSTRYACVGWRTGSLPASTGIGARNIAGAPLTMAAWAVRPLERESVVREIPSPLQCPAPAYGSAFSRAVEIDSGGWRRLLVSGTASIHPDGRTAWAGNTRAQVGLTMDVIRAILRSRDMDFCDVTRATAYHRDVESWRQFEVWRREHGLAGWPVVSTLSVVCRDDLQFELELDAAVRRR